MSITEERLTIRLNKESVRELREIKRLFGETYSGVIRKSIHELYYILKKEGRIKMGEK